MNRAPDTLHAVFLRHGGRIALSIALLLATMLCGIGLLGVSGAFLVGAALAGGLAGFNLFTPSAGVRALTFARIASRYFEKLVGHDTTLRIARDLRTWFVRRALPLAPGRLGGMRSGELLARLLSDVDAVDGLLVRAVGPLLALAAAAAVAVAVAWSWDPAAGAWLLAVAIAGGMAVPLLLAWRQGATEQARAALRTLLRSDAHEGLQGSADLASMHATEGWQHRVLAAAVALGGADRARRERLALGDAVMGVLSAIALAGMLWWVTDAAHAQRLAAPVAAGLFFMTLALLEIAAAAGLGWQAGLAALASAKRLQAVASLAPSTADPARPLHVPERGALTFEGARFTYPGAARPTLDGMDLTLAPGERVALRGDSGTGKSTVSALLLRLHDPSSGRVAYGGVDLRAMLQAAWHAHVAWLPQEAPVFAGTLRANLALGLRRPESVNAAGPAGEVAPPPDADAAMWGALSAVRLAGWAESRGGLDAWLSEAGANVSAGQARRIALARALLRQAPVVVLDEPTEGLDVDEADGLLRDLASALEGRTLLLVTHGAIPDGVVHRHVALVDGRIVALR